MTTQLKNLWLLPTLRGIIALVFAAILFSRPALSLVIIINIFGGFLLIFGLFSIIVAVMRRHYDPRWMNNLTDALISAVIGLIICLWPGLTSLMLIYLVAIWAIISSLMQIITAIKLRHIMANTFVNTATGVLLLVFGIAIMAHPSTGAMTISIIIGLFAMGFGLLSLLLARQLYKATH